VGIVREVWHRQIAAATRLSRERCDTAVRSFGSGRRGACAGRSSPASRRPGSGPVGGVRVPQSRTRNPLLPLGMFSGRDRSGAYLTMLLPAIGPVGTF